MNTFTPAHHRSLLSIMIISFVLALVSWNAVPAEAQGTEATSSPAVILANIYIGDLAIRSQDAESLKIGFTIANYEDVALGDIKYGVEIIKATKEKGQILVDTYVSDNTIALAPKESQVREITYAIPPTLSGEYEVWVMSRNSSGLVLALAKLGTTTFAGNPDYLEIVPESCALQIQGSTESYTLSQGVDVGAEENLSFSCDVTNHGTASMTVLPIFNTHYRSMYGDKAEVEPLASLEATVAGGARKKVSFTIPKALLPQSYDVSIELVSKETHTTVSNTVVAHYVLQGASATIQNVKLDKTSYAQGEELTAEFFWTPSADGFQGARGGRGTEVATTTLTMTVEDDAGVACIDPLTRAVNPSERQFTIQTITTAPCATPHATFTLADSTGKVLSTRTVVSPLVLEAEEAPTVPTQEEAQPLWNMYYLSIAFFTLMLALVGLFAVWKRRKESTLSLESDTSSGMILKSLILMVFVCGGMFGGAGEVAALTMSDTAMVHVDGHWDGDGNWYPGYDMSFGISYAANYPASVSQGQTFSVSGSANAAVCNNSNPWMRLTATFQGNSYNIVAGPGTSFGGSTNFVANGPGGVYPITFEGCFANSFDGYANHCVYATEYITVIGPASCTWGPGTLPWGAGCSYTGGAYTASHGDSIHVTNNSGAGYTPTSYVDFSCNNGSWVYLGESCVPSPVNCAGYWSDNGTCSVTGACGQTGVVQQTFTQTTPASGGGSSCTALYGAENGGTRWGGSSCSTAACAATYTYSFNSNGGSPSYSSVAGVAGAVVGNPGSPTRAGYNFSGWSPSLPTTMPVGGGSATAQWVVAGAPTLTLSASPSSITAGNSSTLTWTVTGTADSCSASGGWSGSKAFTGTNNTSVSPAVTTSYSLECWNSGVSSGVRSTTVTVGAANSVPTATINLPSGSQTITQGSNLNFDGVGSDSDGTIVSYEWRNGSCAGGALLSLLSTFTNSTLGLGAHTIYFRVQDDDGAWSTNCPSLVITVNAAQCSDGIDNADPEDVLIDMADSGCSSVADNDETDVATAPVVTIDSNSTNSTVFINPGDTVTIEWDTNNGDETSCTLTTSTNPDNIGDVVTPLPGGGNAETGSLTSSPLLVKTRFTITCAALSDTTSVEPLSGPVET